MMSRERFHAGMRKDDARKLEKKWTRDIRLRQVTLEERPNRMLKKVLSLVSLA